MLIVFLEYVYSILTSLSLNKTRAFLVKLKKTYITSPKDYIDSTFTKQQACMSQKLYKTSIIDIVDRSFEKILAEGIFFMMKTIIDVTNGLANNATGK